MRRYVLLAAAVAPILAVTAAVSVPGCSEEFENICAFLNDPDSCYHAFQSETAAGCWTPGAGNGPSGAFASRDKLDVCFLDEGGQIVFDPPLDIAAFPPKTMAFKRLDRTAAECGSATFSGEFSYSVTVQVPCTADEIDGGVAACADAGADSTIKIGKTITLATPEGRSTLDVSCTNGSSHHFNRVDIQECATEGQDQLQPRAVLEANAGNQPPPDADPTMTGDYAGSVKLSVHYPQSNSIVEFEKGKTRVEQPPVVVEYFNCRIPAPAPLCFDGEKDGLETDIDCGGTLCTKRCEESQSCALDSDCATGTCRTDSSGFLKCQAAASSSASATTGGGAGAGAGGAGGTGGAGGQ
ncbi:MULTISPECIES: hypothetical protein [Sorangium]|uniref:Secreted protein n=1 Tax=Sorangium cellulosum (strain So ce56) TaxID=448385 RepID=A9FKZ4_SORC5|nr:hypothetical protein [Sorangium cellulosum]CAN95164.1 hypothetical protein predicted by Glimmer/Critica [Sorangium cellulosum So ce56]